MMYYTASGAYRKTKMCIDYASIVLTAVIIVLFIMILFLRGNSGMLFPCIFIAGGLNNVLAGAKSLMNEHRIAGILKIVIGIFLFAVAAAVAIVL